MKIYFRFLSGQRLNVLLLTFLLSFVFVTSTSAHDSSTSSVTKQKAEAALLLIKNYKNFKKFCAEWVVVTNGKSVDIEVKNIEIRKDSNPRPDKLYTLKELLTGLNTQGNTAATRTVKDRNKFIASRIYNAGTDFSLTKENEVILRNNGATDNLITAIQVSKDPWQVRINDRVFNLGEIYIQVGNKWKNLALELKIPDYDVSEFLPAGV